MSVTVRKAEVISEKSENSKSMSVIDGYSGLSVAAAKISTFTKHAGARSACRSFEIAAAHHFHIQYLFGSSSRSNHIFTSCVTLEQVLEQKVIRKLADLNSPPRIGA